MKCLSNLPLVPTLGLGAIVTIAAAPVRAQDHALHTGAPMNTELAAQRSSGEIVKVDKDAAKLTIKHGPLFNLKMPGMTMAFKVTDPRMLDQVKPGDKVRFVAENVDGTLTGTALEVAK